MSRAHALIPLACAMTAFAAGCHGDPSAEPDDRPSSADTRADAVVEPPLLTVTPRAAAMVRQFIADARVSEKLYLRVRVVPGGCQGFMQKLDLDPTVTANDHLFESGGVSVAVFRRQADMLRGAEVDYVDEDGKRGFKVENPNFKGDGAGKWLAQLEKETDIK